MASETPVPKLSLDSSGRASPVYPPQRQPRRQVEDEPRRHDKTYRRYAAGIERALASFDTTRLEWPDYISFLGRLLKAIQSHAQAIDNIPHRDTIASRLAQCLSPALPSGVHQKTIEVYSYVFSLIGKETLAQDLHIYLPGLSPVLTFASLTLRPFFLSLLETHIITLDGGALRPALKALLLCLLPGLEEENSEEFDRTLHIVDSLQAAIKQDSQKGSHRGKMTGEEYFWQCLFLATISSPSRRQGALAFLGKQLPKLNGIAGDSVPATDSNAKPDRSGELSDEAEWVISPEPGLLIRCFAAGLGDEQLLLQRGFLDLLLTHLPLNSPVLTQRVSTDDLEHLVGAAIAVVARRDMSLNRRLWSWFLGPQTDDDMQESSQGDELSNMNQSTGTPQAKSSYFVQFGIQALINSVLKMIYQSQAQATDIARPFRICLSLMDRNEIGNRIIPHIFLPAMDSLLRYKVKAKEEDFQEVLRSANSFFDGIESGVIWGQMTELFAAALETSEVDDSTRKERLGVAKFILEHFNVREEDMLALHVPLVTALLLSVINERQFSKPHVTEPMGYDEVVDLAINVADQLVETLPERAELNDTFGRDDINSRRMSNPGQQQPHSKNIKAFYTNNSGNFTVAPPPLSSRQTADHLLVDATKMLMTNLRSSLPNKTTLLCAKILSALISKLPDCQYPSLGRLMDEFQRTLLQSSSTTHKAGVSFSTVAAITQVVTQSVMTHPESTENTAEQLSELVIGLVEKFWCFLSPTYPKYQLEAVRCIWQLDELLPSAHLIEASLATFLAPVQDSPEDHSPQFESARRFAVLWNHSTHSSNPQTKRVNSIWSKHGGTVWDALPSQDTQNYEPRLHRPLLLLLDASLDTDAALAYFLRDWIGTVSNLHAIFDAILQAAIRTAQIAHIDADVADTEEIRAQIFHQDARPECLYYLQHILRLLKMPSDHMWMTLEKNVSISADLSGASDKITLLDDIAKLCLDIIQERSRLLPANVQDMDVRLQRTALSILQLVMRSPAPSSLQKFHIEDALIDVLMHTVETGMENSSLQVALLDTLATALELRIFLLDTKTRPMMYRNAPSGEVLKALSKVSLNSDVEGSAKDAQAKAHAAAPSQLFKCLQAGISASSSLHVMENWVNFLTDVLPLFGDTLFQNMIPMIDCFCSKIRAIFQQLNGIFKNNAAQSRIAPEPALLSLLGGLEFILMSAHDRMMVEEQRKAATKVPEPAQGFLSNVVSGVFSSEQKNRNAVGNTRLTVILCFQDALKICLSIWAWGGYARDADEQDSISMASFGYVSQRLRNKARRILDRMFAAEALECLETLIVAWVQQTTNYQKSRSSTAMSLLHVLDGSRPKYTMPAIFNAIYSRTNPAAIDDGRMSSLTSDITDLELAQFLVDYTQSLDDDAMDEIWVDCMTFLRDVLMNPLPHHNLLPCLLLFLVILAEKVGNTNFGEQKKMRRDLSDLFLRLLTAIFTTRSAGSLQEPAQALFAGEKSTNGESSGGRATRRKAGLADLVETLNIVLPKLPGVFSDTDRLVSAASNISTNVIALTLHSKGFPENVRPTLLHLWYGLTQISAASKIWKKDISDALSHSKFFSSNIGLVKDGWIPLLRPWIANDKDRITEICARVFAPTAAGNIFGVGASAARLDADKKTQLNLRRIAILTLAAENDFMITSVELLEEKIAELLHATAASSPSSATRAEVFMLVRALLLKTSSIHLATLWPFITAELQRAISSALPRSKDYDIYNTSSLLQACKLLDLLLIVTPDDFQMHEWLFITDTVEAVYRPGHWEPVALVDDLAEELGSIGSVFSPEPATPGQETWSSKRPLYKRPLLNVRPGSADMSKEDFVRQVLRPFFAQLSIHAYESTYSMRSPDWGICEDALLEDLFDDSTMVG